MSNVTGACAVGDLRGGGDLGGGVTGVVPPLVENVNINTNLGCTSPS